MRGGREKSLGEDYKEDWSPEEGKTPCEVYRETGWFEAREILKMD